MANQPVRWNKVSDLGRTLQADQQQEGQLVALLINLLSTNDLILHRIED